MISQPGGVPEESEYSEGNHTTIPLMVATVMRKSGRKRREEEKLQREEGDIIPVRLKQTAPTSISKNQAPPNPNRWRPLLLKHPIGMTHERHRADVGEGFGMRDRAATHQIRYRPTTSKSGRGSREFRAHSSQKKAYYSQILYTCRVYRSAHFGYLTASIE